MSSLSRVWVVQAHRVVWGGGRGVWVVRAAAVGGADAPASLTTAILAQAVMAVAAAMAATAAMAA